MVDPGFERYMAYQETEVHPLVYMDRNVEACAKLRAYLESESDPDVRRQIYSDLSLHSFYGEGRETSLRWKWGIIEEWPDDPLAWGSLANWYLVYCRDGDQRAEDLAEALRHSETAVEKAHSQNSLYLRYVLFDRCRIAAEAGAMNVVEQAMTAVLETLPVDDEIPDIPYLEYDWLKLIADGAVNPDLIDRYMQAAKDTNRSYKKSFPDLYGAGA